MKHSYMVLRTGEQYDVTCYEGFSLWEAIKAVYKAVRNNHFKVQLIIHPNSDY